MAKSANIPLHTWLPDAMEGPTPVSALIHAATLVTAGVYLILRSSPLIEYGPTTLIVITWVGAITAFFAATTGLLQNDSKRIIAYSTCSQIGYLFIAVGLSQYNVALFHLVNHAFFKALLFLAAGAIIHGMADQQDLRRLGGLIYFLPFTYTAILIGSLSLIAFPFLTGIYSKDIIIESGFAQFTYSGSIVYWLGTISAGITAFYSFRLISLTFLTVPNAPKIDYLHAHEAPTLIIVPLVILSIFSIIFGYITKDLFIGIGSDFLGDAIYSRHISLLEAEFALPSLLKCLPIILSFLGAGLALYFYHNIYYLTTSYSITQNIYTFLNGKWWFDVLINKYIIQNGLNNGFSISKYVDRGIVEIVGPFGLSNTFTRLSQSLAKFDTGILTSYALYMMLGLILFIFLLFYPIISFQFVILYLFAIFFPS